MIKTRFIVSSEHDVSLNDTECQISSRRPFSLTRCSTHYEQRDIVDLYNFGSKSIYRSKCATQNFNRGSLRCISKHSSKPMFAKEFVVKISRLCNTVTKQDEDIAMLKSAHIGRPIDIFKHTENQSTGGKFFTCLRSPLHKQRRWMTTVDIEQPTTGEIQSTQEKSHKRIRGSRRNEIVVKFSNKLLRVTSELFRTTANC